MNRKEIKALAKEKIKGNKWNIIWPVLVIGFLESIVERIVAGPIMSDPEAMQAGNVPVGVSVGILLIGLVFGIIMAGYQKYILNFARNGKFEFNDIINCVKEKWLNILISAILTGIIIGLCTFLFVIPGIIMAYAYTMVTYLVIDTDISGADSLKKSREMMKGYKWNYFVFQLSFIGWILLVPLTLGILAIWLYPYMTVADALYYDNLKKLRG